MNTVNKHIVVFSFLWDFNETNYAVQTISTATVYVFNSKSQTLNWLIENLPDTLIVVYSFKGRLIN